MKVFVLVQLWDYEPSDVWGVFSSREDAEKAAKENKIELCSEILEVEVGIAKNYSLEMYG